MAWIPVPFGFDGTSTRGLFSSFDANSKLMLPPDERNCFIGISVNWRKTHASWGMLECGSWMHMLYDKKYLMLDRTETLFSQQAEHELLQTVREFHVCKHEEEQFVSSYVLKMKSYIDNLESLGHLMSLNLAMSLILVSLRKEYDSFVQNYNMHGMGRRGNNQGKGKSKLSYTPKPKIPHPPKKENPAKDSEPEAGALSPYMGNGQRAAIKSIRFYYLCFPSGLVVILHNCHYAPSITRGVISVSRLYDDGFINCFDDDNTILVSRNNMVYFSAVPRDENQLEKTIKSLRSDREGEYMSQEFLDHLKEHGIITHHTPPYMPQYNGVSERRNKTLLDMVRSMMSQTTLPRSLWDYVLESAARILNMVPTKQGCEALVKRDTLTKPDKLEPKSIKCIFVGYPKETMGYSFYYPPENKVFVAQNVEFLKNSLIIQEASESLEDLETIQEEDTHPSENTSLHHKEYD
uniref:Integrase catalytic domain-containing protein n=1 Tax=Tanacetum cinerariifolium TaxID=118510 RepID=A0A699GX18_TANCI|nr:hypothetical protein [Tanacetum cinerariifolium]